MTDDKQKNLIDIFILHKHWIIADSVNYHLRRSLNSAVEPEEGLPKELSDIGQQMSGFYTLSVWYSLLYVVVEGFRELKLSDPKIDELLSQEEYTETLRRFRNATFHFQTDPLSDKLMDFLTAEKSEHWIRDLNRAFKKYFEKSLPLEEMVNAMKA